MKHAYEGEFHFHKLDLADILNVLLSLPKDLLPKSIRYGENEKRNPLPDSLDRVIEDALEKGVAPILENPNCIFSISCPRIADSSIDCWFSKSEVVKQELFRRFANLDPKFIYVCTPLERRSQNEISAKIPFGTMTSKVGRDPKKYVPGLYWTTVISRRLAEPLGVDFESLSSMAVEHESWPSGHEYFKFFDKPEDWPHFHKQFEGGKRPKGVFDINVVRSEVSGVTSRQRLDEIFRRWK